MKIILINPYGPLPNEGWRKYRNILLGEALAKEKHDVVWYTSKFSHHFKKNRETVYETGYNNFNVELVKSKNYNKNISINRLLFEITFCINLYFRLKKAKKIDLIIAVDPSQFVGYLARILSKKFDSKLILDLMDEWPELFEKALPKSSRIFVKPFVYFFKKVRKKNYGNADGIIALGQNYLNLAALNSRKNTPRKLIYNGVDVAKMHNWSNQSKYNLEKHISKLKNKNIKCVYAGSLGMQGDNYDIVSIAEIAKYFKTKNIDFYIAGSGEGFSYLKSKIKKHDLDNLFVLGNLSAEKLARLYGFCDIGLALYGKGSNVDMPDKFYDYSSCGLAILSSLQGELKDIISKNKIGFTYEPNNHKDLIKKLELLANNIDLLNEMKSNSKKIGLSFSIENQFYKINELIDEIYE